jgi:hypothetical protein
MAFYLADGASYSTAKLISQIIDAGTNLTYGGLTYDEADSGDPGDFFKKTMGFIDPVADERDAVLVTDSGTVEIDLRKRIAKAAVGGGAEFATGSAGAGVGSVGGANILYTAQTTGIAPRNSRAAVEVIYRKVIGVGGGL